MMKRLSNSFLRLMIIGVCLGAGAVRAEIKIEDKGDLQVATVTNVSKLEFIVPDPSTVPVNSNRLATYYAETCTKKKIIPETACTQLDTAIRNKTLITPSALNISLALSEGIPLTAPLYTIPEWFNLYQSKGKLLNLMVNGNWFNIEWRKLDGREPLGPGYPYKMPVTTTLGYSVSDGNKITPETLKDTTNQCLFDAMLVNGDLNNYSVTFAKNEDIKNLPANSIKFAVSGFIIVSNKAYVPHPPSSQASKCNNTSKKIARTGIGRTADGNLIVIVKQPGRDLSEKDGWTEEDLAKEMIERGAVEAINLDNSGSSQFRYTPDGKTFIDSKGGDKLSGDIGSEKQDTPVYRPVPNFFGIVDKQK